jgi:hypothetical protein
MKTGSWKDIAEFVGIGAIVASLVFVGLQLKQSHEIAIADQYQNRADAALDFYVARMQSGPALELTAIRISELVESEQLGPAVRRSLEDEGPQIAAMRHLHYRSNITLFDNYHFQYQLGFLTEDAWVGFRRRLKELLSNDVYAELYKQMETQFRSSFSQECAQILGEIVEESMQGTGE